MSWVWKANQRLRTPEQVMAVIIQTVDELGMPDKRGAAICAGMCVAQESDFWCPWNAADPESKNYPYDSQSDDGRSVGYFQQQKGPDGALWWGPTSQEMDLHLSAREFLTRLKKVGYNASNAQAANDAVQAVQRSGVPQGYRKHWDRINDLYNRVASDAQPAQETPVGWTGDPVWLEDVLRPALGDRLKTLPEWKDAGHGDYQDIRGVMVHHTGNSRESAQSIRNGRPDLAGPLSNLHIAPDGDVTIVAVGVCWHAGVGSYPWLPTNNANWHMIGIECAWPDIAPGGSYDAGQRWPDPQFDSMLTTCAALSIKLGTPADHVIGHKEYAGAAQGKWDPGNVDMNQFRIWTGERMAALRGGSTPPVVTPPVVAPPSPPPTLPPPPLAGYSDRALWEETLKQQRGPDLRGWPQLDDKTVVDSLADLHAKVDKLLAKDAS